MEHVPVLVKEVLEVFEPRPGLTLLDATLGHGGHAKAYLQASAPTGRVIGFEADPAALEIARQNLAEFGDRVELFNRNFYELETSTSILFDSQLFDLGIGSHQLDDAARGFSFAKGQGISMAYGQLNRLPPATLTSLNMLEKRLQRYPDVPDLLLYLSPRDLEELIRTYGEERYAGRIAQALKQSSPPATASALAERVAAAAPGSYERGRIHPATRTFQALRLAVNRELETLAAGLPQAFRHLKSQGTLAVISFHSLEDRIVKHAFRAWRQTDEAEILTKKPQRASQAEIKDNPRSRSAKLRAIRKR